MEYGALGKQHVTPPPGFSDAAAVVGTRPGSMRMPRLYCAITHPPSSSQRPVLCTKPQAHRMRAITGAITHAPRSLTRQDARHGAHSAGSGMAAASSARATMASLTKAAFSSSSVVSSSSQGLACGTDWKAARQVKSRLPSRLSFSQRARGPQSHGRMRDRLTVQVFKILWIPNTAENLLNRTHASRYK